MSTNAYSRAYLDAQANADFGIPTLKGSRAITAASIAVATGIISLVILAATTDYARHLSASGQIVPGTGLSLIESPTAAVVSEIRFNDGARVKKGDILLSLDVSSHSQSGPVAVLISQKLDEELRLLHEQQLLRIRQYNVERNSLLRERHVLDEQLQSERDAESKEAATLNSMNSELATLIRENREGLATNQQVQTQLYDVTQISLSRSQLVESEAVTLGQELEVDQKISEEPTALATDLSKLSIQIADVKQKLIANEPHTSVAVVAPLDGVVSAMSIHAGESVRSGEQLAVVLPRERRLIAEVFVDDTGAGFVRNGAPAELELAAFPTRRYGLIHGVVTGVSKAPASSTSLTSLSRAGDDGSTLDGADNEPHTHYRVWISLEPRDLQRLGKELSLPAGSRVIAHISVEKRPLLKWLLDPIEDVASSTEDFTFRGASQ